MKITAASIQNFKRIKNVEITPPADRSIVLIGGKNAQGKSSILDALTVAFGGKRAQPPDPVRHGADQAEVLLELDDGMTIRRRIAVDGTSTLEVRDRDGAVRSPQAMLDKLVGARFLDPLAFLQLPAKEQRGLLMKLIPGADRIDGLNEKRERAFSRRTEIGRDLAKAEGELARLPEVEVGAAIDVAALNEEQKQLTTEQRALDALSAKVTAARMATEEAVRRRVDNSHAIERLERELAELRRQAEPLAAEVLRLEDLARRAIDERDAATTAWDATGPRREQLDADIARAGEHNRRVFEAGAHMQRRTETAAAVKKLEEQRDELTKVIAEIDRRKAEILAGAKLPVDGLVVADDGIVLAGVPFAQASGAERLRVALALAIAAAPALSDVWIRDGALLDEESLTLVAAHAAAAGKRVWIERVGTKDPGVIVIQDGQVLS